MTSTSSIKQIIDNLSEEELNTEVKLSTYFQGEAATQGSDTNPVDVNLANGEVMPWGVSALWNNTDYSQTGDGEANNFGGAYFDDNGDLVEEPEEDENGNIIDAQFDGSYAFVIDSGVLDTTDDLNIESYGWSKSFVSSETDPFQDGNGHGTHVAGTIAAKVNGKGVIGVAPGALITSLKVFDSSGGGASYATVLAAIEYAADIINATGEFSDNDPLDQSKCVINLSLGGPLSASINTAVKNIASTGVQFAIAAGNSAKDADKFSPAGAGDAENVYTVSASDNKFEMASFSNWDDPVGGDDVDVAAPGVGVLSYYKNGQLAYLNGTSMAAPGVAGLLITGGLQEGDDVSPNGAGWADPFALTTNEPGEDDGEEDDSDDGDNDQDDNPVDEVPDDGDDEDSDDGDDGENDNPVDEVPDDGDDEDSEDGDDSDDGAESVEFLGNATGDYGAFLLSSGNGSVSQGTLENALEIDSGILDTDLEFAEDTNGSKTASNATEGSAVKITGTASVGEEINFDYVFITDDYSPYADYSFYTINDKAYALGAIGDNVEDYGTKDGSIGYTFDSSDFGGGDSGEFTIGFGVVDSKDTVVNSYLAISDFWVDDGSGNDESDDGGSLIENPDYVFADDYGTYGQADEDNGAFELTTGGDAINQIFIEKYLDLDLGTLDGSLGSTKGAINATEGSAITAVTNAFVGDIITFDYSFSTNDYQPYKDFSFFSINGNTQKIAAVGEDTPNYGNKIGQIEYELKASDFDDIENSNEVVLGIGIMDALDTAVTSELVIANLEVSEAPADDEDEAVDEGNEDVAGSISDPTGFGNTNINEDTGTYTLTTGYSSVDQKDLESSLGLISNTLDSNLNSTKGAINATEGSAIQSNGVGKVGDTITFDYTFATNDYTPFKDFSFYALNNQAYKLVAVGEDVENKSSTSGSINYTFQASDFDGASYGDYKVSVGIMDALDTAVDSTLTITNFAYEEGTGESSEEDSTAEINLTYETYGDSYKSGDKWMMSTGYGSISQSALESALEIGTGDLDTELESISSDVAKSAVNATEGSGLLATASSADGVGVGDIISFNYKFLTNDYNPYQDFSFLSISGNTKNIAAIGDSEDGESFVDSFGSVKSSYSYQIQAEDINEDGDVTIGLGVVDAWDTCVTSNFSVWDLAITSGDGQELPGEGDPGEDEPGEDEPIEEPADSETTDVIEFQEFGNAFKSSSGMISMSTGYGAVSQYVVEAKSNLAVGTLDGDLNGTKAELNATEGSGVLASFAAAAGDVVSFEYQFGTNDYIPYQDFSYYSVNGQAQALAVVGVDTEDYGQTTGIINYTLTDSDLVNANGGNIQFAVGVMDAWDTCVETSLELNDFKVTKSGAVESNFSGKGLIDGLDAYMVSASLTETFDADTGLSNDDGIILKLQDEEGETLGDNTSENWNISGLTPTFSINSVQFETLGIGTGINNGKVALWTTDEDGAIVGESVEDLDSSDAWIDKATAVGLGYESKFGKDLDFDGLVSSENSESGVVLKNSSDSYDNVALTLEGEAISQAGTDTFTVEKAITSQGLQLFNAAATGYQVLVEGVGDLFGQIGVSDVNASGEMSEITWQSSSEFDSVEEQFGKDIDGNNLIVTSDSYKLIKGNNSIVFKNKKGVAYSDSSSKSWSATASSQTDTGFDVLLKGEEGSSKDGKVYSYETDENGIVSSGSGWKDVFNAIGSGWENIYNNDLDFNGIINGGSSYKLASSTGGVGFESKSGKVFNDDTSESWNATNSVSTTTGYNVVLIGEQASKKEGKTLIYSTDKNGVIQGKSGWETTSQAISQGWEETYQADLDNNGIISGGESYKLASNKGTVELQNKKGKVFSDDTSNSWDVEVATQVESGFKVLLSGEEESSKEGKVYEWITDENGIIETKSGWKDIDEAVNSGWETSYGKDLDSDGLISGGSTYKIASNTGMVELKNKKGKIFSDNSSKTWNATAAVQTTQGFDVLLTGEESGSKDGKVFVWSLDKDGVIKEKSGWQDADTFFEESETFAEVKLPEYFESSSIITPMDTSIQTSNEIEGYNAGDQLNNFDTTPEVQNII